jgi:hypothetical protein
MWTKIFLGLTGLMFVGYGLLCLFVPATVAEATGLEAAGDVWNAEARAMYGGLQIAVGLIAGLGAMRDAYRRTALVTLAFLFVGLATGRLLGIALEGEPGAYNVFAFVYESVSAAITLALLAHQSRGEAAASPA